MRILTSQSRKQHETGLKHQGNKERFIRDLYKVGSNAKHEKARADAEMARIEAVSRALAPYQRQDTNAQAAEAAYAKDTHLSGSRPMLSRMHPSAGASTSKAREPSKPKDKWANYTSAKDMGFDDEDTQKSAYEIEQEIKGRAAPEVGAWQEVVDVPQNQSWSEAGPEGYKRKLGEYAVDDNDAEGEGFTFAHRDKRHVRDPYDDDDWDPKAALGKIKFKSKVTGSTEKKEEDIKAEPVGGLDREKWTGRLDLKTELSPTKPTRTDGLAYVNGGSNKVGGQDIQGTEDQDRKPTLDDKPEIPDVSALDQAIPQNDIPTTAVAPDVKPDIDAFDQKLPTELTTVETAAAPSNLFKKRRPPPGNRKK